MKLNKFFTLSLLLAFLFTLGCHPQFLKKEKEKAEPDSVLFYQKKDVADPFLDLVLSQPHETVVLKTTVMPPPKPRPKFKELSGFRVQIFASADSLNALQQKRHVLSVVSDSVYLVKEKGLYKIQIGNFIKRFRADSLKEYLKTRGFPGAWVTQCTVLVPLKKQTKTADAPIVSTNVGDSPFKIQVFATGDESKATAIVQQLKSQFNYPCLYQKENNLFKIYITDFKSRQEAEVALQKVKQSGYQDAWIVHK